MPKPEPERSPPSVASGVQPNNPVTFQKFTLLVGAAVVAEGVRFSDGTAAMRWYGTNHNSTSVWDSVPALLASHADTTRVVW